MNYYPFHIGDYASATRHLSWDEDTAYRRLLDVYYTTEKPIPLDHRTACRLVLAQTEDQREAVRVVLAEFFVQTDEGWINKRADVEIAAMREKQQKQRDKANKRWHMPKAEPGTASAMPQHTSEHAAASVSDANAMPPTPTPTPTPKEKKESASRVLPCPDDVSQQVWDDLLALRKAKNAPLTLTVLEDARAEAAKAQMTLEAYIRVWCARGTQGMRAEWLKPHERPQAASSEPAWRAEQRERTAAFAGHAAARRPAEILEVDDAAPRLG